MKKQVTEKRQFSEEYKERVYAYHKGLHENDRGYGGSIHKRVRERFNLTSDEVQDIVTEMKAKESN